MGKRIEVTDPHSGVTVKVREGSPQAKAWGKPNPAPKSASKPAAESAGKSQGK